MKIYLGKNKYCEFYTNLTFKSSEGSNYHDFTDLVVYGGKDYGKTSFIKNEISYLESVHTPLDLNYIIITDHPEEMACFNKSKFLIKKVVDMNNESDLDDILYFINSTICEREEFLIRKNLQSLDQIPFYKEQKIVIFVDNAEKLLRNNCFKDRLLFSHSHANVHSIITIENKEDMPSSYMNYFAHEVEFVREHYAHFIVYRFEGEEIVKGICKKIDEE